jgi:hypothetical protein
VDLPGYPGRTSDDLIAAYVSWLRTHDESAEWAWEVMHDGVWFSFEPLEALEWLISIAGELAGEDGALKELGAGRLERPTLAGARGTRRPRLVAAGQNDAGGTLESSAMEVAPRGRVSGCHGRVRQWSQAANCGSRGRRWCQGLRMATTAARVASSRTQSWTAGLLLLAQARRSGLARRSRLGGRAACDGFRAAAAARCTRLVALGIDAEPHRPLPEGVADLVLVAEEQLWIDRFSRSRPDTCWDCLVFSAKESVFEAWYPITHGWLDFDDVVVTIDPDGAVFRARPKVPRRDCSAPRSPVAG